MALKATRRGVGSANNTGSVAPEGLEQEQTETTTSLARTERSQRAVASPSTRAPKASEVNAGILDNIDDMDTGGNYVTIDGSEFLYKATQETAREIDCVIHYGKRFYQWYDEANNQYHNSDTKLDDRYRLKFEIRWNEGGEDDEVVEHIMTLPTASAMRFIDYVNKLARESVAINEIVTRMSISRQVNTKDKSIRYSRVEFKNMGLLTDLEQ